MNEFETEWIKNRLDMNEWINEWMRKRGNLRKNKKKRFDKKWIIDEWMNIGNYVFYLGTYNNYIKLQALII